MPSDKSASTSAEAAPNYQRPDGSGCGVPSIHNFTPEASQLSASNNAESGSLKTGAIATYSHHTLDKAGEIPATSSSSSSSPFCSFSAAASSATFNYPDPVIVDSSPVGGLPPAEAGQVPSPGLRASAFATAYRGESISAFAAVALSLNLEAESNNPVSPATNVHVHNQQDHTIHARHTE